MIQKLLIETRLLLHNGYKISHLKVSIDKKINIMVVLQYKYFCLFSSRVVFSFSLFFFFFWGGGSLGRFWWILALLSSYLLLLFIAMIWTFNILRLQNKQHGVEIKNIQEIFLIPTHTWKRKKGKNTKSNESSKNLEKA